MEPSFNLRCCVILSDRLAGSFHWNRCNRVADCAQEKHQSPVGIRDPSIKHLLAKELEERVCYSKVIYLNFWWYTMLVQ